MKKLKFMPSAQAHIEQDTQGNTILISYTTKILTLTPDGWLTCTGLYSATTRRHISAFMREYGAGQDYYFAKSCYENNIAMNIYTGEVIENG